MTARVYVNLPEGIFYIYISLYIYNYTYMIFVFYDLYKCITLYTTVYVLVAGFILGSFEARTVFLAVWCPEQGENMCDHFLGAALHSRRVSGIDGKESLEYSSHPQRASGGLMDRLDLELKLLGGGKCGRNEPSADGFGNLRNFWVPNKVKAAVEMCMIGSDFKLTFSYIFHTLWWTNIAIENGHL